jgi:uncharacterized protein YkwD
MARLQIACPGCRVALSFDAARSKQQATCPACGQRMSLPVGRIVGPRWFAAQGKQKVGPYELEQLRALVAAGRLRAEDMLLPEGSPRWVPAHSVTGLLPATPAAPAARRGRRLLWAACLCAFAGVPAAVFFVTWPSDKPPAQPTVPSAVAPQQERPPPAVAAKPRAAPAEKKRDPGPSVPKQPPPSAVTPPAPVPDAPPAAVVEAPGRATRALARLNAHRRAAGLPPVTLSAALSKGCLAHAEYLVTNTGHPSIRGTGAHDEDPQLPGFSEAGRRTARHAVVAGIEPAVAVDGWMATLYHRVPLLGPELQTIGLGFTRGGRSGWVAVLDVSGSHGQFASGTVVCYPADRQRDVPLAFPDGGEFPNPLPQTGPVRAGFPVTATFPRSATVRGVTASLRDAAGQPVAVWLSAPDRPANPSFPNHQGATVCLIPQRPLAANAAYTVAVAATVNDAAWTRSWAFTTGPYDREPAGLAERAVARINACRKEAGLAPLTLDPALSGAAAAHARYLVVHADDPSTRRLGPNAEDPKLAGFSSAGQDAARGAFIYYGQDQIHPLDQVEDWMAGLWNRVQLLNPDLQVIGLGSARDVGKGWVLIMSRVLSGVSGRVVIYPADGQTGVPTAYSGGVEPDPIPEDGDKRAGYPVTITFPPGAVVRGVHIELREQPDRVVSAWVSTPEKPAASPPWQQNTVCLMARDCLRPHTSYAVTATAVVDGVEWRRTWSFTTGANDVCGTERDVTAGRDR